MKSIYKQIDNDITYLLGEISHNVKIQGKDAKAIINNTKQELNFDDKKIITDSDLARGDYVGYNNLNFLVMNEINDKRYKSYNKATMRNCSYDIKPIIGGYLFKFPAVFESDTSVVTIAYYDHIATSINKLIVTLPYTTVTSQIDLNDRFISMGEGWEVENVDLTKNGLVTLTCKSSLIDERKDDIENEIANRWDGTGDDLLNGNITPIEPFDPLPEDFEPELPVEPDPEEPTDPVEPEPEKLEISGKQNITVWDENIEYTVNTDKAVTWSLDTEDYVYIAEVDNNKCYLNPVDIGSIGDSILRVELVGDSSQFAEMFIGLYYQ